MLRNIKAGLKKVPLIGPLARQLYFRLFASPLVSSENYWETRYKAGGDSGAGSHDRLAQFKAEVVNKFVQKHSVRSVIELGCGDGKQLALAEYPEYVGIDVSATAIDLCRSRFADDTTKKFVQHTGKLNRIFDLALSLDVIYHLVEDDVFMAYMNALFDASHRWVIVYSSNTDEPAPEPHIRHRQFTDWVKHNRHEWTLVEKVVNRYPYDRSNPDFTSFSDFYVYELKHAVRMP